MFHSKGQGSVKKPSEKEVVSNKTKGTCECPNCGYEHPHRIGSPCNRTPCPECRTFMARIN